jgi:hypothetical protein
MKKLMLILICTLCVQGCGIVKGTGKAIGSLCQGVGYIGDGIQQDLTAASDGHSDEYYKNRHKK